jgi:hypothetical protein
MSIWQSKFKSSFNLLNIKPTKCIKLKKLGGQCYLNEQFLLTFSYIKNIFFWFRETNGTPVQNGHRPGVAAAGTQSPKLL